jgi:hypothetical protein
MMPVATAARSHRRIRRVLGVELPRVSDGRSADARLFRRLVEVYVRELGGEATLTEFDKAQISQLVIIEVRLSSLRKDVLEGRDVPADKIIRLSSEHRRVLSGLRAKATVKPPAGPSLDELFAVDEARAE